MALPVIASTLTTLAAFSPLLFWTGTVGEFMNVPFPMTLIVTLSSSLFVAPRHRPGAVQPVGCGWTGRSAEPECLGRGAWRVIALAVLAAAGLARGQRP